jgi:glycerol-3-phosphate acyltransferase PlsY
MTLVGDMLKTALAVLVAAVLFGFHYQLGISVQQFCYVAGLFAVLGHVFPIYYKFKGGKGVLATSTMALILTPIPFAILLAVFIAIVWASKYVSLGSVCVATLYPVVLGGYVKVLGERTPGLMMLSAVLLAVFIVFCHKENLKRISERTERKISFGKGKKEKIEKNKSSDADDAE